MAHGCGSGKGAIEAFYHVCLMFVAFAPFHSFQIFVFRELVILMHLFLVSITAYLYDFRFVMSLHAKIKSGTSLQ